MRQIKFTDKGYISLLEYYIVILFTTAHFIIEKFHIVSHS
jgi:hypothetical protein